MRGEVRLFSVAYIITLTKECQTNIFYILNICSFVDYEAVVKLSDGFNGADIRNICTEAGMFAIREERDYVVQEDFMKAVRKVADAKKLEGKLDYEKI